MSRIDSSTVRGFKFIRELVDRDGASTFERLKEEDYEAWLEEFTAGQLLANNVIPGGPVHEFEAILFANSAKLAAGTGVPTARIEEALARCGGSPEAIDNGLETAPSRKGSFLGIGA